MRALVAFGFIFVLIASGWKQSFETQWSYVTGKALSAQSKRALRNAPYPGASGYGSPAVGPAAPVATPKDRSWIFGRTVLDPPNSR